MTDTDQIREITDVVLNAPYVDINRREFPFAVFTCDPSEASYIKLPDEYGLSDITTFGVMKRFEIPPGQVNLRVKMWGGGGGGGSQGSVHSMPGGPGGSGSYYEGVIPVGKLKSIHVFIGAGGLAGAGGVYGAGGGVSKIGSLYAGGGGGGGGDILPGFATHVTSKLSTDDHILGGQGGSPATNSSAATSGKGGMCFDAVNRSLNRGTRVYGVEGVGTSGATAFNYKNIDIVSTVQPGYSGSGGVSSTRGNTGMIIIW
jgi:hypothetical protein